MTQCFSMMVKLLYTVKGNNYMKSIKDVLKQKPNNWLKLICKSFQIDFEENYKKSKLVEILSNELSRNKVYSLFYSFLLKDEIEELKKCIDGEEFDVDKLLIFDAAGYIFINRNNDKVFISDLIVNYINNSSLYIDERVKLFYDYFKAFSNLYGLVHLDYAIELVNEYENQNYTKEQFMKYVNLFSLRGHDFEIADDKFIINTEVYMIDDDYLDKLIKAQDGKDYAHLPKDEVLEYLDAEYYEKTPQLEQMAAYFMFKLKMSKSEAIDLAENVAAMCQAQMDVDMIFEQLEYFDVYFYSESDYDKFVSLYKELNNNVRTWENRGNTPAEIRKQFEIK